MSPTRSASLAALATLLALASRPALAASPGPGEEARIEDNSFLVEEAYNQEPRIIQHIFGFQRFQWTRDWILGFTEEWPFFGQADQVSVSVAALRVDGTAGAGDLLLNYRREVHRGESVVFTGRLSAIVPVGDAAGGRGVGGAGLQLNFPLSVLLGPSLVSHTNAGATWVPRGEIGGVSGSYLGYNLGQSVVWLVHRKLNFLMEAVWTGATWSLPGADARQRSLTLSPGFRHLVEIGEVDLVWGAALPVGVGPSAGDRSYFLYMSVEHSI